MKKKKQKLPKLLILYKSGDMKKISEKKLNRDDLRKAKYLLVPILRKKNTYWCVRPSRLLLSAKFIVNILVDASIVDYEESLVSNYGTIPSHLETSSPIQFINFLCTLYKLNGYGAVTEDSVSDLCAFLHSYYPAYISVTCLDTHDEVISHIETEERHEPEGYVEDIGAVYDRLNDQASHMDEFIFGLNGDSQSIDKLPKLIEVEFNAMKWRPQKKITKCQYGGYKFFKVDYFGAYFLGTDDIWHRCMMAPGLTAHIIAHQIDQIDFVDRRLRGFIHQMDHPSQTLQNVIKDMAEYGDYGDYTLMYTAHIADPFAYLIWLLFSEDIVTYATLMTYMMSNTFKDIPVSLDDIKVFIVITEVTNPFTSPDTLVCSQGEALLGKIRQYLLTKLYKEDKRND